MTVIKDQKGYFGSYGGRFVPEILMPAVLELERGYREFKESTEFRKEFRELLKDYVGRPTPLFHARRWGEYLGARKVYLKREDLNHTGAHKINNALGQALLARFMGKTRVIAETGAGQHGVAVATAAALLGLECRVFMGQEDIKRQLPNVQRMELLGAEVIAVQNGSGTLKEAINAAIKEWVERVEDTFYIIGSVVGPHPYPLMVREFQSVIGEEVKKQVEEKENSLPDYLLACVGGGSNAMGLFHPFLPYSQVKAIGVEAGGKKERGHASTLQKGSPGILHGSYSYLLQDEYGRVSPVHSSAPGLDYPGVGPEHSYLKDKGRASYMAVEDEKALDAFYSLSEKEGIIPAMESAHALAGLQKLIADLPREDAETAILVVNLSGRGDKDLEGQFNF